MDYAYKLKFNSQGKLVKVRGCVVKCEKSPDGECFATAGCDDDGHEDFYTPCDQGPGRCPWSYPEDWSCWEE